MKYFLYLKCLFKERQWRYVFHFGDIILAMLVLISLPAVPAATVSVFGGVAKNIIAGFSVFGFFSLISSSLGFAHRAVRSEKAVFYKMLGFRNLDFFFVVLHSFLLSAVSLSVLLWVIINSALHESGILLSVLIFLTQTAIVYLALWLFSKIKFPSLGSKRIQNSSRLFKSKYFAFAMKDFSVMLSSPGILFFYLIGAAGMGILLWLKIDYAIAVYLICAYHALGKIDIYNAANHQFLYQVLRLSKYDVLWYRLVASAAVNMACLLIYTLLNIILVRTLSLFAVAALPILILNALAQHFTMDAILSIKRPIFELSPIGFVLLWLITVVPGISLAMYIFAFAKVRKLRKETPYA